MIQNQVKNQIVSPKNNQSIQSKFLNNLLIY